jgi:cyanophycinase
MIAPARAIMGGYRVDGIEVCSQECAEELDEVEIRNGLGFAPFVVEVHAAQSSR